VNCNWGFAYTNGVVVLAEGFDVFRPGVITTGWNMNCQTVCPYENTFFFWMYVWEFNPEV
jgi:hypothetical protein